MDIYFDRDYGKLYEKIEGGIVKTFEYDSKYGKIYHQFIERQIDEEYKDLITPYGYGGPVILEATDKKKLVREFEKTFGGYCAQNNIVSEFVRFHPLEDNAPEFLEVYNCERIRSTLATNLVECTDPLTEIFSKSCRKNIRQALNKGVSFKVTENPVNIDSFIKIYYETMGRNDAADYYYFDKEYFDMFLKKYRKETLLVEAIFEDKVIAAGFYFFRNGVVHIHLSGTLNEYLYLSPAYILRYAVILWANEHKCTVVHHGGGRSNSPEDSLFKFKKQFSNMNCDFYVGRKIWNEEVYNMLCKKNNAEDSMFFPKYRSR